MKYGKLKIEKIYWSTQEVIDLTGVPAHTLRYWEHVIPFLQVPRNRARNRTYRKQEIEFIQTLSYLLKNRDFSVLEAGKEVLKISRKKEDARQASEVAPSGVSPKNQKPKLATLFHLRSELLEAITQLKKAEGQK